MSNTPSQPGPTGALSPALVDERERVVQTLAAHYADDRLSLEAFEARLDRAYGSSSSTELQQLLADLGPAGVSAAAPGQRPRADAAPAGTWTTENVPERGFAMAVMGGVDRRGRWAVPRQLNVRVLAGGAKLDLREARFNAGVTNIDIFVFMGGVQVLVPSGVRVECSGAAMMGGFTADSDDARDDGRPVIRVNGMAVWGGVEVQTRLPGESERAYRRRRRGERRMLGR